MPRTHAPAVEGWFTAEGAAFTLLGTRCRACASVFFPREDLTCRNPGCGSEDLVEVPLSRRGRLWSFTDARYRPPAPYLSDPGSAWEPFVLLAVELAAERLVVLGQAPPGTTTGQLTVGMAAELVPGVLRETGGDGRTLATWNWRPLPADESGTRP
ncbi:Zn-ribbon domain-containing OB-fold protein [Streptomyces axinellae]|uniref:Zinc ribbon domain-containing protein n=1 Tax=Streptomyces axinellae TaxID=552788 RepID=A0ABN3PN49_9ACTN